MIAPTISAETIESIAELYAEGVPGAEIARQLGLTDRMVRRYKDYRPKRRPTFLETANQTWPLLAKSWAMECSNEVLAKLAGCSKFTVHKYRHAMREVLPAAPAPVDDIGCDLLAALERVHGVWRGRRVAA